jgi:hypothetical protein
LLTRVRLPLSAYVDWLIEQPISAAPLERVPEQARAAALEALRGLPREVVRGAVHLAIRDAIFLVELVLRLNSVAEETIRIEGLRYWEMRALSAEAELARRSRSRADRQQEWCSATAALLTGLYAAEEARALLERRYLDGHPALFPDAIEDWGRLRESAERLAGLGDALRPLMEGRRGTPRSGDMEPRDLDLDALRSGARAQPAAIASRLVDEARAATLDAVGDTEGASLIAARRLRAGTEAHGYASGGQ